MKTTVKKNNEYALYIDYMNHPKNSFELLMEIYSKEILVLDTQLATVDLYEKTYQDVLDLMKYGFEIKKIREFPIRFKFNDSSKVYSLQARHFLSNLILWYSFVEADIVDKLSEEYIYDFRNSALNSIINHLDDNILPLITHLSFHDRNKIIDEIVHNITAISAAFSPLLGLGISTYSIIQAAKRNPRIDELLHDKIDSNMQPTEIEKILSDRTDELIKLFSEDVDNDLKPIFLSGNNLSKGQFKEIAVMIGLKSDINGNTIPFLIDKNIMVDGISSPSAYYIDGLSGRKALILSKTKMGEPGAFSKKITTNTTSITLNPDSDYNCNSVLPLFYTITDDKFLQMMNGRYYYDTMGQLHMLNYKTDKHLIGQYLGFKSPTTCTSKNGICRYCYGNLYHDNEVLESAGAYAAIKESEPYGQTILSSKHLQVTYSDPIVFDSAFYEQFELNANEITLNQDNDTDKDLFVVLHNVQTEESDDSVVYFCTSFDVVSAMNKLIFRVQEENNAKIYLTEQMIKLYKYNKDKNKPIALDIFEDDSSVLFNVEVKNKELTKPIKNITKLLNTNDKLGCDTIDKVCQMMGEMKLEGGIHYDFVHHEMMIRGLIRKKSNYLEFPDFTANGDVNDYSLLRLNDALFKNPSPTISLSYGYLRKQLLSPDLYTKNKPSHLDALFVENLYDVIEDEDRDDDDKEDFYSLYRNHPDFDSIKEEVYPDEDIEAIANRYID